MPKLLSATDCISPALAQAKKQLFSPFQFKRWFRLATICLLTGEFAGGGGGGGGNLSSLIPRDKGDKNFADLPNFDWDKVLHWLPWIVGAVFLLAALVLLFLYVASVYRFVLFDSVLNDRCELKGSWTRWQRQGRSYFLWSISFSAVTFFAMGVLMGIPLLIAWQAGLFRHPGENVVPLIVGGLGLFFVLIALLVVCAIIGLFAKDFCVAIMAMDEVGIVEAWHRLYPMILAEKGAFAFYVLMKIVLAIATAIIAGIITLIVILVSLIPLGIGGVALFFLGKALGLGWNWETICAVVALSGILIFVFFYILAFISTPFMVFFQSYVLHFIGSRYAAVGNILFPPSPEPPPLPPMDSTLLPPPLPDTAG